MPNAARLVVSDAIAGMESWGYSDPQGESLLRDAYLRHAGISGPDGAGKRVGSAGGAEVLVTAGGKEAAWLAIQAAIERTGASTALVPRPGWAPYAVWLQAAGCRAVFYDPARLVADPDVLKDLVAAVQPCPGLIVLNYPHNPTGITATQPQLDRLMTAANSAGLAVVSDEVYRPFGAAGPGVSAALAPAFDPACDAIVDSTSKWLASAGLRVGFLVAGQRTIREAVAFRGTYASCTSPITQQATAALLADVAANEWLNQTRKQIAHSTAALGQELTIRGVPVVSHGGMYVWCRTPAPLRTSPSVPRSSPAEGRPGPWVPRVRLSAGEEFGVTGHIRICTARAGLDPAAVAETIARQLRADVRCA